MELFLAQIIISGFISVVMATYQTLAGHHGVRVVFFCCHLAQTGTWLQVLAGIGWAVGKWAMSCTAAT